MRLCLSLTVGIGIATVAASPFQAANLPTHISNSTIETRKADQPYCDPEIHNGKGQKTCRNCDGPNTGLANVNPEARQDLDACCFTSGLLVSDCHDPPCKSGAVKMTANQIMAAEALQKMSNSNTLDKVVECSITSSDATTTNPAHLTACGPLDCCCRTFDTVTLCEDCPADGQAPPNIELWRQIGKSGYMHIVTKANDREGAPIGQTVDRCCWFNVCLRCPSATSATAAVPTKATVSVTPDIDLPALHRRQTPQHRGSAAGVPMGFTFGANHAVVRERCQPQVRRKLPSQPLKYRPACSGSTSNAQWTAYLLLESQRDRRLVPAM